jgi:hypothetical protein
MAQASQSVRTLSHVRLTASLPTAPSNKALSARSPGGCSIRVRNALPHLKCSPGPARCLIQMFPSGLDWWGQNMGQISMATRDELVVALAERYASSGRQERGRILDGFAMLSGLHRKHAMRLLC